MFIISSIIDSSLLPEGVEFQGGEKHGALGTLRYILQFLPHTTLIPVSRSLCWLFPLPACLFSGGFSWPAPAHNSGLCSVSPALTTLPSHVSLCLLCFFVTLTTL